MNSLSGKGQKVRNLFRLSDGETAQGDPGIFPLADFCIGHRDGLELITCFHCLPKAGLLLQKRKNYSIASDSSQKLGKPRGGLGVNHKILMVESVQLCCG